jgi:SAM-dependent methyltransferase
MDRTIEYYDNNSEEYIGNTINYDLEEIADDFLTHIPNGGIILDAGCGSGRDSLYFTKKGYKCILLDASINMCEYAHELTGCEYQNKYFTDIDEVDAYDGIWASASMLHVPYEQQHIVWKKFYKAVRPTGVIFASYYFGRGSHFDKGRYFYDTNGDDISDIIKQSGQWDNIEVWMSKELRNGRQQMWTNIFAIKK